MERAQPYEKCTNISLSARARIQFYIWCDAMFANKHTHTHKCNIISRSQRWWKKKSAPHTHTVISFWWRAMCGAHELFVSANTVYIFVAAYPYSIEDWRTNTHTQLCLSIIYNIYSMCARFVRERAFITLAEISFAHSFAYARFRHTVWGWHCCAEASIVSTNAAPVFFLLAFFRIAFWKDVVYINLQQRAKDVYNYCMRRRGAAAARIRRRIVRCQNDCIGLFT